jgi:hypothetical protein
MFTATEIDVNGQDHGSSQPDRHPPRTKELLDALACTSSPQWSAAPLPLHDQRRHPSVLL